MKFEDFEDDLDPNKEIKNITLDLDIVKRKIPTYSSEKLCEMIVCERYLGFHPDVSVMCMEELASRRINGDVFPFEDYIEKAYQSLPKLDFQIPDIKNILLRLVNQNKKK